MYTSECIISLQFYATRNNDEYMGIYKMILWFNKGKQEIAVETIVTV